MCTVLLRLRPGSAWPVVLGAVRDEFTERAWDPPAAHWDGPWAGLLGGRDRTAGGTWMAVDPDRRAVAALLNGPPRPPLAEGAPPRPTRGTLALEVLASGAVPDGDAIADYDAFHLLLADADGARIWSWDGERRTTQALPPGDHLLVNLGPNAEADPLVGHFRPLLEATADPDLDRAGDLAGWTPWVHLLAGDGLDPEDPRALIIRKVVRERSYGSTSASLVALGPAGVRYAFNAQPTDPGAWAQVADVGPAGIEPATEGL